jgi:hypothetical protein
VTTKEKTAGVLDTPTAVIEKAYTSILEPQRLNRKEFDTLRARFARRGYRLQRVFRAGDGRPTYHASRTTQTRVFSHPHDVGAFLAVVEGLPV